jgi:hypothetical protein
VIRVEHARLLGRETAPLTGNLGLRTSVVEELLAGNASALETTGCGWTLRQWTWRTGARRRQLRVGRPGRGQLDHVIAFPNGPTNVTNFAPQCPLDHNGKTHGGWVHALDPQSGR